jgi:C4-dicarboxylate transporter DctM subunit
VMPFLGLMFAAVFLLCLFPEIATGLPNLVMGVK